MSERLFYRILIIAAPARALLEAFDWGASSYSVVLWSISAAALAYRLLQLLPKPVLE